MSLLDRYIFRNAAAAFAASLLGLTAVIWVTQALRELDLITGKGQTILTFLTVTSLSLPTLIAIISPVALFIATIYTLNRLNGDSELIVMSAAGCSPRLLLRPFIALATLVCIGVGFVSLYMAPASFQELREIISRIRADFVANVVKEGQFTTLDSGITFHYRERNGETLIDLLMQDRRDRDRVSIYLAERGQMVEANDQSYLVLENGSIQQQRTDGRSSSIVLFERYAVDLSTLNEDEQEIVLRPRERSTFRLFTPDTNEWFYQNYSGRFRAELHDRLSAWLYPLALALVAFAALGDARTTRQGRGAAIATAIIAIVVLRILGFAASSASVRSPAAVIGIYAAPVGAILVSLWLIFHGEQVRASGARAMRVISRSLGRWTLRLRQRLPRLRKA